MLDKTIFLNAMRFLELMPTFKPKSATLDASGAPIAPGTLDLFYEALCDLPDNVFGPACLAVVNNSDWVTPKAIRDEAVKIMYPGKRTGAEAWEEVERMKTTHPFGARTFAGTDSNGEIIWTYANPVWTDPATARIVAGLGWRNLCHSDNVVSDRARFIDAYNDIAKQYEHENRLPPQALAAKENYGTRVTGTMAELTRKLTAPTSAQPTPKGQ